MANKLENAFQRIWPSRVIGLAPPALPPEYAVGITPGPGWQKNPLNQASQAAVVVPSRAVANSGFQIQAGQDIPGPVGKSLSLTIVVGSGTLSVASNGMDITVTEASGGSTATAIIAAINAQFSSLFCVASKIPGSSGAGKPAALAQTFFVVPYFPAPPNS